MAQGNNNNLPVGRYEKVFRDYLQAVYGDATYFGDFSAGGIEALDGVSESATAFSIKTTDIPVTVNKYSTNANVAFGTGTANSSRFGTRTEIKYINQDVPYADNWAINEGLDRFTVNNNLQNALADRLAVQAKAKAREIDSYTASFIESKATKTVELSAKTIAAIDEVINELAVYYTDLEVNETPVIKLNPEIYQLIVDGGKTVKEKGSTVNIDRNEVRMYKDFVIDKVPTNKLPEDVLGLVYIPQMGKVFTGIATARTMEAHDFDGIELQGAGKYGAFVSKDNEAAIAKIVLEEDAVDPTPVPEG